MFGFTRESFKIISQLGEGLNADVFKVEKFQEHLQVSRTFALKVLKRSEDVNHFKTEFETLLKTNGKHLVKYCGWETYNNKPALLLEYINGITLQSLLQSHKLTGSESAWIYQEAQLGLQELEASGMFHGDLSPGNIMIDSKGEIKLIDFGLTHWRTKSIELTPEFAARSVLNGEEPCLQSDTVSLDNIFNKFNLNSKVNAETHKPSSLGFKVKSCLDLANIQTQSLTIENQRSKTPNIKAYFQKTAVSILCFAFISPVTARNHTNINKLVHIRSSKWHAVKSTSQDEWCYTPCSLTFTKTGVQQLIWKTQTSSGRLSFYLDGSPENKHIDLSSIQ